MTDSVISDCEAIDYGYGYGYGFGGGVQFIRGSFIMSGSEISDCKATIYNEEETTNESVNDSSGGSVWLHEGSFTMTNGATIKDCGANKGGGVYASGANITMKDNATIENCTANVGGGVYLYQGGGMYSNESSFSMKGAAAIANCNSDSGGGVYLDGGIFNMEDNAVIKNCQATSGGGVYAFGDAYVNAYDENIYVDASFEMRGGEISGCTAQYGGAVFIESDPVAENADVTMSGVAAISNCHAETGGGVYIHCGSFKLMDNAAIKNCQAQYGGGVHVNKSSFIMSGGEISGCKSSSSGEYVGGGGVHVYAGNFDMTGGTISACSAANGGGIYNTAGVCTMSGGRVSGCTATANGGGIYVNVGDFIAKNNTQIYANVADGAGDDFYSEGNYTTITLIDAGAMADAAVLGLRAWYEDTESARYKDSDSPIEYKTMAEDDNRLALTTGASAKLSDQTDRYIQYISGYDDGTFRPDSSITRAEVAQMLCNISGGGFSGQGSRFCDISDGDWYFVPVMYLEDAGVVSGYSDGTFKPNSGITRAEFVTLVEKYANLASGGEARFSDVNKGHWAYEYIAAVEQAGYIGGYGDGTFRPDGALTRAEAVTIINAMLGNEAGQTPAGAEMSFSDVPSSHWAYFEILTAYKGSE